MKPFLKLAIYAILVLVNSVAANVDLCCTAVTATNEYILDFLDYIGSTPSDLAIGCTPLESSCPLLAWTCEESFLNNTVGANCVSPGHPPVPPGSVNLCCAEVVGANYGVGNTTLDTIGYMGPRPFNVAPDCVSVDRCLLVSVACLETLANNTVGINCIRPSQES
ncbi:hypothetical protein MVEN_00667300 [Mycena venus]|uniref:Hydrophobin n=1 Tax=Mycena venus TaxID=2733690 RepID=A0A8H7D8V3_9AGAR|nr:hypothetical protein MVEN_00667300 [Mycena venus]